MLRFSGLCLLAVPDRRGNLLSMVLLLSMGRRYVLVLSVLSLYAFSDLCLYRSCR